MRSIRARLVSLFILVPTFTLVAFGLYSQHQLSSELETRFLEQKENTRSRLEHNVPIPLWNYDLSILQQVVAAELRQREVAGVFIAGRTGEILLGAVRGANGTLVDSTTMSGVPGTPLEIPLTAPSTKSRQAFGKVFVFFSREHIDRALRDEIARRALEVLVVDILLVVVLVLSLNMVFRPLGDLRDALFALASHDDGGVEELPTPETSEFAEVVDGFNRTQQRLQQVIFRHIKAETTVAGALEQLKHAQAELVKAERLAGLGNLVAGIAHELNTPIGNGLVAITTLEERTADFKREIAESGLRKTSFEAFLGNVEATVNITKRSIERSSMLVNSFKQVAVDQTSAQRREFTLQEVFDETLLMLGPKIKKTPYRVNLSSPERITLDSYPGSLVQVLTTLVDNCMVHGFDGRNHGIITISASSKDGATATIRVADDGKGMDKSIVGKVFDPFFTTRLGMGGLGLGLHVAHNSVTLILGGKLGVVSEPERGTEFALTIPLVAPRSSTAAVQ